MANESPLELWCVNGRMMKAGTKNNPMHATAHALKTNHKEPR